MGQPPPKKRRLSADIDLTTDDDPTPSCQPQEPPKPTHTKQDTLASLFRPPAPSQGSWLSHLGSGKGCGHFEWRSPAPSRKVAAFDIDGTLIQPQGGRKYPKNDTDWQWLNPHVVPKLRKLHADGFAIVLFSNQGLKLDNRINYFKRKMPLVARALDIPLRAFAAFDYNEFRKPAPGMWLAFEERFNGGVPVDYKASFFVGDAAGRQGDHSDTDHKFALNCGLRFVTPEELFLDRPPPRDFTLKGWDPRSHDHTSPLYSPCSPPLLPRRNSEFDPDPQPEVVLFVGFPGVGKTSFYRTHFAPRGYVHVNQDTLKTRAACLDLVRASLLSSPPRSVVVDNTSPSAAVRAEYLSLVRSLDLPQSGSGGVRVRCLYFTAPIELAMHNSVYRALHPDPEPSAAAGEERGKGGKAVKRREVLPMAAFLGYKSKLEVPTLDEGFDDVKHIHFQFSGPPSQLDKWQRWLGDVYGFKPLKGAALGRK
ncbi:polynucleotide kinase 3 phosphatase-domain-containing protein [Rhodotorula diobovata]|uniref:Polynucleotide kinase 3 phosphatase-domain-containing protein n=1 Tax=Rhodotorula diobovata TaxID=5288 RepID=A0A5C5G651_9BASI|nr:polynucleotide kinase 3 phosphatase-domain-containing protein [Rhodotorula diobovata]